MYYIYFDNEGSPKNILLNPHHPSVSQPFGLQAMVEDKFLSYCPGQKFWFN